MEQLLQTAPWYIQVAYIYSLSMFAVVAVLGVKEIYKEFKPSKQTQL